MKWKEFFAATLPKSKKSRRKAPKHSVSPEQSGTVSGPECDDIIIRNQNLHSDLLNGNRKKKRSSSTSKVTDKLTQIAYSNKQLVSPDFVYFNDRNTYNPYDSNTLSKSYSNASESGFEDGSDCQNGLCDSTNSRWCCSSYEPDHSHQQPDLLPSLNHTFARERTRIKTNPWVSSPSKVMTSSMYSDVSDRSSLDRTLEASPIKDSENNNILHVLTPNRNCNNGNYGLQMTDSESSDTDWFSQSDKYPPREYKYETQTSQDSTGGSAYEKENDFCDTLGSPKRQSGVVKGGNLVINLNTGDVFVKPKPVFSQVSFKYEENLNATLERDAGGKKKRSRRHRQEEYFYKSKVDTLTDSGCNGRYVEEGHNLMSMDYLDNTPQAADQDSGTLTRGTADQWTYQSSDARSFRKRGLRKRDSRKDTSPDEQLYRNTYYQSMDKSHKRTTRRDYGGRSDVMYESSFYQREGTDSAYDSSTLSSVAGSSFHGHLSSLDRSGSSPLRGQPHTMTLPSRSARSKLSGCNSDSKRSLEEIHCSLKDKVERLRAEKRVVDAKVKQAKEEDELKREEKSRIQKEVSSLRKQVLLKTLQELKENLENQSCRLQDAYDDVLDMQWLNAKLRRLRNTTI